jgi:hypothetical protein
MRRLEACEYWLETRYNGRRVYLCFWLNGESEKPKKHMTLLGKTPPKRRRRKR